MRILAVEDNDPKWARVEAVIRSSLANVEIVRARDQLEGERLVDAGGWDLLILDMSLDIRAGGARFGRGAHDYTGGLKIAGRMFYLEREIPTIIVTGFDAFPTSAAATGDDLIMGLEDVETKAREFLRDYLLGAVRFGSMSWETTFSSLLDRARKY